MDMGNFGFPKMNFSFPNQYTTSSDSSDSDSDTPNCYREDSDSDVSSTSYEDSDVSSEDEVDAAFDSIIKVPKKKYHSCYEINFEDISEIEFALDLYEFISLIFLLFDDTSYALQVIRSLIASGPDNFSRGKLSEWAGTSPENWKFKLFEALAVIQNNNILIKFGLCKKDIDVMSDAAPLYINRFKKVLFSSVCDVFKKEQAEELINRVRCDAKFEEDITLHCDPTYIEFHILFWISQGYINIEREPYLENLTKHLRDKKFIHIFKKIDEEVATWLMNTYKKSDETKIIHADDEEYYKIRDPNNPGLVVVINNAYFEKNVEKRKEFQHLLPEHPLLDRKGSDKDAQKVKRIFEILNYKVVIRNDIFHDKLVDVIYDLVRENFDVGRHSILVLFVLSHGDKGMVYGANSIPLKKKEIINSVSGSSPLIHLLADIPKIIVIQACQGKRHLYVKPEPELLVPDGAGSISPGIADKDNMKDSGIESYDPRDRVVCMATVKDFVALRNVNKGTPYIQELCSCIEKYHTEKHFLDIMTEVQRELTKRRCIVKQIHEKRHLCMVPETKHTLSKHLYLTRNKSIGRHQ